jgi:CO/xanthine dehydrogenase Mo-binding subunit
VCSSDLGIGAGFMTTVAGHAAMDRCRAFRGWNEVEAKRHMLSQVGDFYTDVKDIFFKDVWGSLRSRAGVTVGEAREKVADALDETGSALDDFIRQPIKAVYTAGQSVVDFSAAGAAAVRDTGSQSVSLITRTLRNTGSFFVKTFKKQ